MPCTIFYPRPMTRREQARAWMDGGGKYPFSRTDDAFLDQIVGGRDPNDGPIFACGSEEVPVCRCGHMADILCDWPVGRGKTCDLPLCSDCTKHIGDDQDLCAIHFAMFSRNSPLPFAFSKGPKGVP